MKSKRQDRLGDCFTFETLPNRVSNKLENWSGKLEITYRKKLKGLFYMIGLNLLDRITFNFYVSNTLFTREFVYFCDMTTLFLITSKIILTMDSSENKNYLLEFSLISY